MATTADRVLPWRRHSVPAVVELKPLIDSFRRHHAKASTVMIEQAYRLAAAAHDGQFRKSGDPYVTHPLAVATIVADLGLDAGQVGWAGGQQEIVDVSAAEARQAGEIIEDEGEAHLKIVEFLDQLKVL